MKTLHSTISTALASDSFTTFFLIDIRFSDSTGPMYQTSLPFEPSVAPAAGGNAVTYGNNLLDEFSPPHTSTVVDREVYRIRLVDNTGTLAGRIAAGNFVGDAVTVRMGVNDNTTNLDTVYQGRIDSIEYDIDFGEQERVITLECSSPFADLGLVNLRLTTGEQQDAISNTDTCFDEVGTKVNSAERAWGKKGLASGGGSSGGGGVGGDAAAGTGDER